MTAPLEIKIDPRLKNVTMADLQKEFDLATKIAADNTRLHTAVNQIHELRSKFVTLRRWAGDNKDAQAVVDAADQFDKKMTPIEEQLMQVQMKSSEGNLRYPNMLNEQYDSLSHSVEYADAAPTASTYGVYDSLHRRLEEQLAKWNELVKTDLPGLNQLMHSHNVPSLRVGE